MSKYYYLIAGLPNIALDDSKLTYTVTDFRNEYYDRFSEHDKKIIDLFFLKFDNRNLIQQMQNPDSDPDPRGVITYDEFNDMFRAMKEYDRPPANKRIPPYYADFFKRYLSAEEKGEKSDVAWEDMLASLYYTYAMTNRNEFVADWFEFNLNINNVLTAITCRKYDLPKENYIIGDNEIAEALRTSNARDFGLGESWEYLSDLQRIAEESDLYQRERRLDLIKWQWLDEHTFFKPFDIETIFAYLVKLEMIERWVVLDKETGEKTFRELVGAMKKGSDHALDEFKRNNTK